MITAPLRLWNHPHWELRGCPDITHIFGILRAAFPSATTLFLEGACIAVDVRNFFDSAAESGPYFPACQTIRPRPKQFQLPADELTLERLMKLAALHAEPLIEYPDAQFSDSPILISRGLAEQQVRWFAQELRLEVAELEST